MKRSTSSKIKWRTSSKLYVVILDVLNDLDRNNLQYADTLMALAKGLIDHLQKDDIAVGPEALIPLEKWFTEHVKTEEDAKELLAQLETGAKLETGMPLIGKLFAGFTTAAKTNATYKDSLRTIIRNTFTQFANAFNTFLAETEAALKASDRGERVLFVIDGTDKLSSDDTQRFFIADAEQLLAIEALMLYTAPLSLKYDGTPLGKVTDIVLPIIKLSDRHGKPHEAGRQALRDILLKRADASTFADPSLIEQMIDCSGGHPRELLRLLALCCEFAEGEHIVKADVDNAIKALESDYRRFLEPEDYALLVRMDRESELHGGNDERTHRLLYRLALLEYNDGSWRRSHPVVRLLEGYKQAEQRVSKS